MSTNAPTETIVYPDTDGLPMAENTVQYDWITKLVGGLRRVFRHDPNVFVAGDLFWYPVEGNPAIVVAPDAMVAIGRPRGPRMSYRQWEEGNIAPQVVFEVLSQSNTPQEMKRKLAFYATYGVEEYYVIEPFEETVEGWLRQGEGLMPIDAMNGWVSPKLEIRFETADSRLTIFEPDGRAFEEYEEVSGRAEESEQRAKEADQRAKEAERLAIAERQRAKEANQCAKEANQRAERLAETLRALGIDPNA